MKRILYPISFLVLFALAQSCKKDHDGGVKQVVIDTTLASGIEYQLNLQPYGDADDSARIVQQATTFTTSEIVNGTSGFNPVYHYAASTKTGLTDKVILSVREGSHNGGTPHAKDSTVITINFTVK